MNLVRPVHVRPASVPSRSRRAALRGAVAAALSNFAWAARAAAPVLQPWPRDRRTPDVRLPLLDGGTWGLSDRHGQPLLLNFWATWCEPCREEMPSLAALARREDAAGLRVVAANYRESDAAVRRFVESTKLDLPVVIDRDGSAAKAFGVHAFPSTVGIDRQGHVRFVVMGECDWADARSGRWVELLVHDPAPRGA